jgi:hypothetical protein
VDGEFAAWPHAIAPSSRQTNPNRVILRIPPRGSKRSVKILAQTPVHLFDNKFGAFLDTTDWRTKSEAAIMQS